MMASVSMALIRRMIGASSLAVEQIVSVRQLFGEGIEVELVADVGHHAVRLRRITLDS
ncbi:hypothetical protein LN650_26910 [Klebsiella pneumoniae subsp. pneumoniae]|nr:hypothetical protein [Klebsiella pneumoniae subsp. pneumoniae]